jgi:OmpA-OmpF porin, OOP family
MKKLFTFLLFTAIYCAASSQMRLGIMGGPQSSSVIETNNIQGWSTNSKPYYTTRSGFNLGIIGEIPIGASRRFYFQPGLFYMTKGRKYERFFDTLTVKTDTLYHTNTLYTNYFDIPLNLVLKLRMGKKSSFMLSAGPYVSFFYNGKQTSETRAVVNDSSVNYSKAESNIEVGKVSNKANTFDVGFNARAGFELGNVLLTGFISQGLTSFYHASYDGTFKHKVIGASVGFWLSKRVDPKPSDRDNDGVPDKTDMCPDVAGSAKTGGCPDRDGDGITDALDNCPDIAGTIKTHGCPPDTDNDGIFDKDDKCPDKPGPVKYHGCPIPDQDGDGVNDEADLCPDKKGPAEFNGCPVPDTDGDGIIDTEDKCPTIKGTAAYNGCPPPIKREIIEKVNYAARKIFFATGSDKIVPGSFGPLDEVVAILKNNPTLKLVVEGHSDNVGNAATNLILSQKRADAVKNYLIQKGIDGNRLMAKGYGQENPVADNNTPEGRAANRRVELKLSQQ